MQLFTINLECFRTNSSLFKILGNFRNPEGMNHFHCYVRRYRDPMEWWPSPRNTCIKIMFCTWNMLLISLTKNIALMVISTVINLVKLWYWKDKLLYVQNKEKRLTYLQFVFTAMTSISLWMIRDNPNDKITELWQIIHFCNITELFNVLYFFCIVFCFIMLWKRTTNCNKVINFAFGEV